MHAAKRCQNSLQGARRPQVCNLLVYRVRREEKTGSRRNYSLGKQRAKAGGCTYPFSINQRSPNTNAKKMAMELLKRFSSRAEEFFTKDLIDTVANTMTLEHNLHDAFGNMDIHFDNVDNNIYEVKAWDEDLLDYILPKTITFTQHGTSLIELPSKELLELHRSIGRVLHMSGAAKDVDVLLRQLKEAGVDADGETSLGDLVSLRLGGLKVRAYQTILCGLRTSRDEQSTEDQLPCRACSSERSSTANAQRVN
ncbi:hypothetical protein BDR22DRAFT_242203 [Usnea florida]